MLRFFEQKAFCGCKSQIFVFGYWIAGRGDRAGYPVRRRMRLGDAFHWLGVSLEAILRIRRLRRSVCGAHGCSAPPPQFRSFQYFGVKYNNSISCFFPFFLVEWMYLNWRKNKDFVFVFFPRVMDHQSNLFIYQFHATIMLLYETIAEYHV